MKKYLGILLFLFVSIGVFAQEHLTFKGIPIDGSLNSFVNKLESQGFRKIGDATDNMIQMKGPFGGEECFVVIYGTKTTHTAHTVIVIVEESNTWSTLKSTYYEYKASLAQKYEKTNSIERFKDPYYEGDGYEISALRLDKCFYASYFKSDKGNVYVAISYLEGEGVVILSYEDLLNSKKDEGEETALRSSDL
ncbi:MAG: hypothetical protein J6Q25_09000 [Bacteroidales bacterium]|nr:hypothetical protein [Bacteroidales bacterium]